MSQAPGFAYDIFISYSHEDNHAPGSDKGWVTQFHEQLDSWLHHRRGLKQLTIWRDKELQGNTLFDDAIKTKIESSAFFFVLHSINYANSDYCRKELDWFIRKSGSRPGGLNIGEHSRIFHILLNNFPYKQWPEQLSGTSGFAMHDAEDDSSLGDFSSPGRDRFQDQLRIIVDATQDSLEAIAESSSPDEPKKPNDQHAIQIFIADTDDSQAAFRKRLTAELRERGNRIIAAIPPPYDAAAHQQKVSDALQEAKLSIHLLGQYPGREIQDQNNKSYPCEQAELGFSGDSRQIIWLPPELDIQAVEDLNYRDWLLQLDHDERNDRHYEFVRSNPNALTELILQEIDRLNHLAPAPFGTEQAFLIDTHQKDQHYAYQLAGIMSGKGIDVEFNKESQDPVESMNLFEQSIQQVPNLIIIFGRVSPEWIMGRIKQAIKILATQFDRETALQLEKIWIYLTPGSGGSSKLPALPSLFPITLLDNSQADAIDEETLSPLFTNAGNGSNS